MFVRSALGAAAEHAAALGRPCRRPELEARTLPVLNAFVLAFLDLCEENRRVLFFSACSNYTKTRKNMLNISNFAHFVRNSFYNYYGKRIYCTHNTQF